MNREKVNNGGFSLVELIIAIAILSIVGMIVVFFIGSGTRQYTKTGNSVKLQSEAQLAMDQMQELIMDATNGISYLVNDTPVTRDAAAPAGAIKKFQVYNTDTTSGSAVSSPYYYSEIRLDQTDPKNQKLYYSEYRLQKPDYTTSTTWTKVDDVVDDLLAEYVTDFSIDLSNLETNHVVRVKMGFQVGSETFEATKNITVRNRVVVNGAYDDIFK